MARYYLMHSKPYIIIILSLRTLALTLCIKVFQIMYALLEDSGDVTPGQVAQKGTHPRWSCMSEMSPTCESLSQVNNSV